MLMKVSKSKKIICSDECIICAHMQIRMMSVVHVGFSSGGWWYERKTLQGYRLCLILCQNQQGEHVGTSVCGLQALSCRFLSALYSKDSTNEFVASQNIGPYIILHPRSNG